MVTDVEAPTGYVVTLNVFDVCPAVTVTLAGAVAAEAFELVSVTTAPPVGAAFASVTVPVEELPPRTLVGESESDEIGLGGAKRRAGAMNTTTARRLTFAGRKTLIMNLPLDCHARGVTPPPYGLDLALSCLVSSLSSSNEEEGPVGLEESDLTE